MRYRNGYTVLSHFKKLQDRFEGLQTVSTISRTDSENAVIEQLMEDIFRHGLSADQAKVLLGQTIQLLEWGKQAANKLPEANA